MATIVTVTLNPCVDKTFTVDRVTANRKLSGTDVRCYPGGGGINVARAVISLGGQACASADYIPAPSVPRRSRVGAGDSMIGGMVCRLAAGDDASAAARYAVAAGTASVMTPGTELCRRDDTDRLYQQICRRLARP